MNIKEFLIDNYIWIIIIILITIITIIGFLADKKKNGKKNENPSPQNSNGMNVQPLNNMGQMQYNGQEQQTMQNQDNNNMGMGINANNLNNSMQQMNQGFNFNATNTQNVGNINPLSSVQPTATTIPTSVDAMNNPTPVENITPNVTPEPIYQPLSEQKPVIPPQPVPNFSNVPNNQIMVGQQVENIPNKNISNVVTPVSQASYGQNISKAMNQPVQPQFIQQSEINQTQNNQIPTTMQQEIKNDNFGNMSSFNQGNTTVPKPINTVPIPKPVNPQPIMQGTYNNSQQMMQPNYGQQPMNQPVQPQQSQPVANSPINFVYGPQNNNQNM